MNNKNNDKKDKLNIDNLLKNMILLNNKKLEKVDITEKKSNIFHKNKEIIIYTLKNSYLEVEILNLGGIIKSIKFLKSKIPNNNLVLSYEKIEDYLTNYAYIGATIGRTAGRIKDAQLKINDKIYKLENNDKLNNLHGGSSDFSKKMAEKVTKTPIGLTLFFKSPHLEGNFPANINIIMNFNLHNDSLSINYLCGSDRDTYINMTNHSYFNFNEDKTEIIENAKLYLNSDYMVELDNNNIPYKTVSLDGNIFDFRKEKYLSAFFSQDSEQKTLVSGIDHPFLLNSKYALTYTQNGISMSIDTDAPAVVIYSGNFLADVGFTNQGAICFEVQEVPNMYEDLKHNIRATLLNIDSVYKRNIKYIFKNEN